MPISILIIWCMYGVVHSSALALLTMNSSNNPTKMRRAGVPIVCPGQVIVREECPHLASTDYSLSPIWVSNTCLKNF